jgi:hypothetical protein
MVYPDDYWGEACFFVPAARSWLQQYMASRARSQTSVNSALWFLIISPYGHGERDSPRFPGWISIFMNPFDVPYL